MFNRMFGLKNCVTGEIVGFHIDYKIGGGYGNVKLADEPMDRLMSFNWCPWLRKDKTEVLPLFNEEYKGNGSWARPNINNLSPIALYEVCEIDLVVAGDY